VGPHNQEGIPVHGNHQAYNRQLQTQNGRLYLKDGPVELTDGVSGGYKAISELKPLSGTGFPITRIKEIFPDLETQGRPLERAGLAVLRDGLKDVTRALEAASSESTEQAVGRRLAHRSNRLPPNIVGVPTARYQNFLRQLRSYETVLSRYAAQRADHLSKAAELERSHTDRRTPADIQQTSSMMRGDGGPQQRDKD
jgi:hypothetical protein